MDKQYREELLQKIKEKEYMKIIQDVPVLIKPIPEDAEKGMMDPRVYKGSKKMATMMRFVPKRLMKIDASPKSIERLRGMFNGVKSIPVTSDQIKVMETCIKGKDENDLSIRLYLPIERKEQMPVLYFMHGGGFFAGHMGVVEQFVKMIVEKYNLLAISIDYRLAPENPYPKGHEDCLAGLTWVYENCKTYGGDPKNIFVAGDSAGGNLAQYCTTKDIEMQTHMVKGQLLMYPTVNMGGIDDAYVHFDVQRYDMFPKHKRVIEATLLMMAGDNGMTGLLGDILGTKDTMNPYLSPYGMDVSKLPPTLITVGEHDFLNIECLAYARKLVKANVEVKTIVYKGMGHAYGDHVGVYPQSEDCAIEMGKFIMEHVD